MELVKEADFFGDVVIVPYMDNYDLVVLKTVAICEYGVRAITKFQHAHLGLSFFLYAFLTFMYSWNISGPYSRCKVCNEV